MSNKPDEDIKNQTADDAAEAEEEVPQLSITLNILSTIQTAQNQNGLRHGDYMRYRRYCSRKMHRLRKTTKLTCGRGKFQKKAMTLADVQDVRHLMILLFEAERCWSYALDLKHELTDLQPDNHRLKFHIKRRMSKACQAAENLYKMCQDCANKRTLLESEGYFHWMQGNLASEEGKWEEALAKFEQSKAIFGELAKITDSLDSIVFSEKIEQIEPFIRYCQYNFHGSFADPAALKDLTSGKLGPYAESLKSRVEDLLTEEKTKQVEEGVKIDFNGQNLTIKNDKTRLSLQLAEEAAQTSQEGSSLKEKLGAHVHILSNLEDATRHINNEKKEAKIDGSSGASTYYKTLLQYVQYKKHMAMLNRAVVTMTNSSATFDKENEIDNILKGGKAKHTKPKDVVKTIDNALHNIDNILDILDKVHEGQVCNDLEVKQKVYTAWRCKFVALSYAFESRFREAVALMGRTKEKIQSAAQVLSNSHIKQKNDLLAMLKEMDAGLLKLKTKMDAKLAMQSFLESNPEYAQRKQAEMEKSKKNKKKKTAGSSTAASHDFNLVDTTPKMEPMPAKPIIFDLVWNRLDFPDVSEKTQQSKGILGRLGWGRLWGS
eukprot:CAMPEP_0115007186 /NCGR_PEP_ID=MMETSP0216-20121206/21006_1 /TAXON_ID=223996 /ORGANISM="Protocruzia adherens, Strain Boccale" /LENGTH=602 /DNA_ID=CAMNT_0002374033 /DNA_START=30 /DNA_END=1838 /DNA_ORIENTATION=-